MGKKRSHKPKGSNALGLRSLSRMNCQQNVEDDDLDRPDFVKISKSRRLLKREEDSV